MNIDLKKPIVASLFGMVITFVLSMIVLSLTKPKYILKVSQKGRKTINVYLLIIFSMLVSVLIGITILLWRTGLTSDLSSWKDNTQRLAFNPQSYRPRVYSP